MRKENEMKVKKSQLSSIFPSIKYFEITKDERENVRLVPDIVKAALIQKNIKFTNIFFSKYSFMTSLVTSDDWYFM